MALLKYERAIKIPSIPEIPAGFIQEYPEVYNSLAAMKEQLEVYEQRGPHSYSVVKFKDLEDYAQLSVVNSNTLYIEGLKLTGEPTGFPNWTDSQMSFDDGTRTFTIEPTGDRFSIYSLGNKLSYSTEQTVTIDDTEGIWFISFDTGGILRASQTVWDFTDGTVMVAIIYWNPTSGVGFLMEERHGMTMDSATHGYLHHALGSQYESGFTPSVTADGDGSLDAHCEMQEVSTGEFHDEDNEITNTQQTTYEIWYRLGADGDWYATTASAALVSITTSRPDYNEWTGATWQRTEVANTKYTLSHIFATNKYGTSDKVIVAMGQAQYDTKAEAYDGAENELPGIYEQFPTPEFIPIATVIIECKDSYTNTYNARVVSDIDGNDFTDYRGGGRLGGTGVSATDHGGLTGLLDDDHTQYLRTDGTRALTGNWDVGSFYVQAERFISDIATGTAPFTVSSTTLIANLNADLLDSQEGSYYLNSANFTGTNWTDLTDAGATTLHKHDHGGQDGLLDDDHTQYLLMAGRSGGQIVYGGTGVEENLQFFSTTNATKGRIIFGTEESGLVFDEDDETLTIGGGENSHTINGVTQKSLFEFHLDGNTAPGGITFHRHSNTAELFCPIVFLRSRGDHSSETIVQDGDAIGGMMFTGFDGTDNAQLGGIRGEVDGTPGNDDMPGRIRFFCTPSGSQTPAEVLRLSQDKTALFAGAVTVSDIFTSVGIYDGCTARRISIVDTGISIGDASSAGVFSIGNYRTDGAVRIWGDNNANSAMITVYGSAYSTKSSDIQINAGNSSLYYWDESAGSHTFYSGSGSSKIQAFTIDSSQNITLGYASTTALNILMGSDLGVLRIGGGSSTTTGSNIRLYGDSAAGASNISFYDGSNIKMTYYAAGDSWTLYTDDIYHEGTALVLGATAAGGYNITQGVTNGWTIISGGIASGAGANLVMWGGLHATTPNYIRFRQDTTTAMEIAASAVTTFYTAQVTLDNTGSSSSGKFHTKNDSGWYGFGMTGATEDAFLIYDYGNSDSVYTYSGSTGDHTFYDLGVRFLQMNSHEMTLGGTGATGSYNFTIQHQDNDQALILSGGTDWNIGTSLVLYGSDHANADIIKFRVDGTDVAEFSANGEFTLKSGGINFPNTIIASSDANTLDDYEEGTWTPVLGGTGGTSGQTYNVQLGTYTKIGRVVHVQCWINLSNKGTITDSLIISGLPFTVNSVSNWFFPATFARHYYWTLTSGTILTGYASASNTYIVLQESDFAGGAIANLTTSNISNSTNILVNCTYFTAD